MNPWSEKKLLGMEEGTGPSDGGQPEVKLDDKRLLACALGQIHQSSPAAFSSINELRVPFPRAVEIRYDHEYKALVTIEGFQKALFHFLRSKLQLPNTHKVRIQSECFVKNTDVRIATRPEPMFFDWSTCHRDAPLQTRLLSLCFQFSFKYQSYLHPRCRQGHIQSSLFCFLFLPQSEFFRLHSKRKETRGYKSK